MSAASPPENPGETPAYGGPSGWGRSVWPLSL